MGKTEPFPLLCDPKIAMTLTRDASAAATARAAKVVDVCFLCAPDWKETRALEDTRRDQIAGLEARHATYDAKSRAFAELPLAARTALVESRVEQKKQTRAFPKTATAASAETSVEPAPTPVEPSREERADVTDSAAHLADIELAAVAASAAETAESLTADCFERRARRRRKSAARAPSRIRRTDSTKTPTPWPPTPWPPPTPTRTAPRPHGTSPIRRMISRLAARARLPRSWRRSASRAATTWTRRCATRATPGARRRRKCSLCEPSVTQTKRRREPPSATARD